MVLGTCTTMCPAKEITERKRLKVRTVFETSDALYVKEYRRSAAGRVIQPEDVRTFEALEITVRYLLGTILDVSRHSQSWLVATNFISDRLRAVRQDIIVQQLPWQQSIKLLEKIIRFHIYLPYVLHFEDLKDFDPMLNSDLTKTYMTNLFECYDNARRDGQPHDVESFYEFHSYFILLNMKDSYVITKEMKLLMGSTKEGCRQQLSAVDGNRKPMSRALDMAKAYHLRNFCRFFRQIKTLTLLQRCCLLHAFTRLCIEYLTILNTAYSSQTFEFPLQTLKDWLLLDDSREVFLMLEQFGFREKNEKLHFDKRKQCAKMTSLQHLQITQQLTFIEFAESACDANRNPVDIIYNLSYK